MKTQHTPAPWKIDTRNSLSIIDNLGDDRFDKLICQTNGKDRLEAAANAKLIASAPELLDMLKKVHDWIQNDTQCYWLDCPEKGGFDLKSIQEMIKRIEG